MAKAKKTPARAISDAEQQKPPAQEAEQCNHTVARVMMPGDDQTKPPQLVFSCTRCGMQINPELMASFLWNVYVGNDLWHMADPLRKGGK